MSNNMLRISRKTTPFFSNNADELDVPPPRDDEEVSFVPGNRFFRDVTAFSTTTSTKAPATDAADSRIFDNALPANNTALSFVAETHDVMNSTSSLGPNFNDRQADAAALLGFGFSILLYFGLVVCLAYRGRTATKHNLDYCLVHKKVLPHDEAHKFTKDSSIIQNSTCCLSRCKHFSKDYSDQGNSGPVQKADDSSEKSSVRSRSMPKFKFICRRTNCSSPSASTSLRTPQIRQSNHVGMVAVSNNLVLQNGCNYIEENCDGEKSSQVSGESDGESDNNAAGDGIITTEDKPSSANVIDERLKVKYNGSVDINKISDDKQLCPICLCDFEVGESVVWSKLRGISGGCKHVFHHECFVPWAQRGHLRCPVCRDTFWSMNAERAIRLSQVPNPGGGDIHNVAASSNDTVITEREFASDEEVTSQQNHNQMELSVLSFPIQQVRVEFASESNERVHSTQTVMDVNNITSKKQPDAEPWYRAFFRRWKPLESIAENSNFCVVCGLVSLDEN